MPSLSYDPDDIEQARLAGVDPHRHGAVYEGPFWPAPVAEKPPPTLPRETAEPAPLAHFGGCCCDEICRAAQRRMGHRVVYEWGRWVVTAGSDER